MCRRLGTHGNHAPSHSPRLQLTPPPLPFHPSQGSWDALGVHYRSGDSSGSWADPEIIELVKKHNAKV